jgi:hypothetical protein
LNDRGREAIREMNRLGMVINVSHASDEAISAAIDTSADPVVATHHGLRAVNDIPRNMPDALVKKLAAKGGVIGFQLGNEFHNRKAFEWGMAHAGKAFWDNSAALQRGTQVSIYELDKIVGPLFPVPPADIPREIRLTVDAWWTAPCSWWAKTTSPWAAISMADRPCRAACATYAIWRRSPTPCCAAATPQSGSANSWAATCFACFARSRKRGSVNPKVTARETAAPLRTT